MAAGLTAGVTAAAIGIAFAALFTAAPLARLWRAVATEEAAIAWSAIRLIAQAALAWRAAAGVGGITGFIREGRKEAHAHRFARAGIGGGAIDEADVAAFDGAVATRSGDVAKPVAERAAVRVGGAAIAHLVAAGDREEESE